MITIRKSRSRARDRKVDGEPTPPTSRAVSFQAPIGGWVENENVAASSPLGARVNENVFPTDRGSRVRGGCVKASNLGAAVVSMFTYETATAEKLFAATSGSIFDVSALDPDATLTAVKSGQTLGYYSSEQIGTVGGDFLIAVNGADDALLYDGTTFADLNAASTPSITGIDTADLKYVWKHKNRLWFVEKDSKSAWYLPVDSVGGAAAELSLSGVFQGGGTLLFGATWSADAGDGMDDRIIFCSTEGEVAVYQGTNPASASDWTLVGVFKTSEPLGPNCHIRAGGDVVIGTRAGIMPISEVVSKDPATIELSAITSKIRDSWRNAVLYWQSNVPWELHKWDQGNMLFAAMPNAGDGNFVANANTGAWAKYTGWDAQCAAIYKNRLFFGAANGYVYEGETSGSDDGEIYVSRISLAPTNFGQDAAHKSIQAVRATFLSEISFNPQVSISTDYNVTFPSPPSVVPDSPSGEAKWDVGDWDVAIWDYTSEASSVVRGVYSTGWVAEGASGFDIAPQIQISNGSTRTPDAELVTMDLLAEVGGVVV